MEREQLSKRERKKLAKEKRKEEQRKAEMSKKSRNLALWVVLIAIVGFLGFKVYEFFTAPLPQQAVAPIEVVESDHTLGNKDAKAVLIEFADFQCPACKAYHPLVKQLNQDYPDDLLIVYRHFPLTNIHRNAMLAATASEAASNQDKFWEMNNILFERQEEWANDSNAKERFIAYAEELGLDLDKFTQDLDSEEIQSGINADILSGNTLGVKATPTFYLNGKKLENVRSYEDFKRQIDSVINE